MSATMGNEPFFTIITASFNNESTIKQTLESIKNQTFQNLEHFIVDGNSNDGTIDVLKEMEHSYNMYWISEPDCGIADALNKGLRKAQGQYIIIIHADDRFINPHILENVYPLLNNEEIDILSFPVIMEDPVKEKVLRRTIRCLWWNHFKFIFQHQGCFVHKRIFEQIGHFKEEFKIALDYDFFYRALKNKCSVQFEKTPIVIMGGEGIGSRLDNLRLRLKEEHLVQRLNEKNEFWRLAQYLFHLLYIPYKTRLFLKGAVRYSK